MSAKAPSTQATANHSGESTFRAFADFTDIVSFISYDSRVLFRKRPPKPLGSDERATLPAIFPLTILDVGKELGLDSKQMLDGLAIDARRIAIPLTSASWHDTAILFERLKRMHPEGLKGFVHRYCHRFPFVTWVGTYVTNVRSFYLTGFRAWRWDFLEVRFSESQPNRLRLQLSLRAGARPCIEFFEVVGDVLRELPQAIRKPRAAVTQQITATGGAYEIFLEGSCEVDDDPALAETLFQSLRAHAHALAPDPKVPPHWRLTPAEKRVVLELATGASLRAISDDFGVSIETVRSQLKSAMAKAGVNRQIDLVAAVTAPKSPHS
jgi:DNA-binding CsgD family transcriptional regulator